MDSRSSWKLVSTLIVFGFISSQVYGDTFFSPETDLYLDHNAIFRSRLVAAGTYNGTDGRWSGGNFEYDLDFGLISLFRRYVYRDPNAEKAKRVSFRIGYAYIPDWNSDEDAKSDEKRAIAELTLRFPVSGKWLLTDKNKGNFRRVDEESSVRYRNQLRIERGLSCAGIRSTPYASAEVYYDTGASRWNRFEAKGGIEFPWKYSSVLEFYFTHQANWQASPNEFVGFVLQKFMALPIGATQ